MDDETAIRTAAPVLARYGSGDQAVLRAWLLRAGLPKVVAAKVTRFVPLAFGRDLLEGTGVSFSDTYVLLNAAGEVHEERKLSDESIFVAALRMSPVVFADFGGDVVTAVSMLSPEFQAVNSALNAGAAIENLVAGPPVVSWEAGVDDPAAERPWWKFWGRHGRQR